MIAGLMPDRPLDIENLKRIECQATMVPLRIRQTGDRIENRSVDALTRTHRHDYVLMQMMFRHEFLP